MDRLFLLFFALTAVLSARVDFLMPDEAFKPKAELSQGGDVKISVELGKEIYLYKDEFKIVDADPSDGIDIAEISYPEGVEHHDEMVYLESPTAVVSLARSAALEGEAVAKLLLKFQGCSDQGLCYEPQEKRFELSVDASTLPVAPGVKAAKPAPEIKVSETDRIAQSIRDGDVLWIILTFLGFGLLLSLTPCVFPMIPILSSVIVSQGTEITTRKAFFLSLVYVLAMSVAYTLAGVVAGLFGANLQAAFQNPLIISSFAIIFVILALSMFDLYELQMPNFIQSKLTRATEGHSGVVGVALMGFLSALIVGPCVAAPLAGALIYIGQTGDALLGGVALFSLSIGMGVPLLIVGTSAGRFMPQPGAWMDSVKAVFGVLLLGVAIWMISRVVEAHIALMMWALLLIFSAVSMGAFEPIIGECIRCYRAHKKGLGIVLFMYGVALFVGSLTGATNPLDPLEKFRVPTEQIVTSKSAEQSAGFKTIHTLDDLTFELERAKGKQVLLDFYADWCTACQEYEHVTFKDPAVRAKMSEFVLLQADVTANTDEEKALTKHFGLYGPPGIIFFDETGAVLKGSELIGYQPPETFLNHLNSL